MFTGKVRLREFVFGYEWCRFQYTPHWQSWLDELLTAWLQLFLTSDLHSYQVHYKDVHVRNVLFEIRNWETVGVPVLVRDWQKQLHWSKVGLRPIDIR